MVSLCCLEKVWHKLSVVDDDKTGVVKKPKKRSHARMYGVYAGYVPGARNTWSYWIDYILTQQDQLGFVAALMLNTDGVVSAFTPDFVPLPHEIDVLNSMFDDEECSADRLSFVDRTYIIRVKPVHDLNEDSKKPGQVKPRLLVAFSGSKYLFICRTITKYVVVQSDGRRGEEWQAEATHWLCRLGQKLITKNF